MEAKHFQLIATAVRVINVPAGENGSPTYQAKLAATQALADVLALAYPNEFDRTRFVNACL